MNESYEDIRDRIAGDPLWWDEHAVPRYCEFHPQHAANIYASEVCLLHIECQGCSAAFRVCISRSKYQIHESARSLVAEIKDNELHYGDPPNVGCCASGPTMNSVPHRVLEFWRRDVMDWERLPEHEVAIEPDWWHDG